MFNFISNLFNTKEKLNNMPDLSVHHIEKSIEFINTDFPRGKTLICGDSHAELWGNGNEDLLNTEVINCGVGGDLTSGVIDFMPFFVDLQPSKVILSIGSNNLGWNTQKSVNCILPDMLNIITIFMNIPNCQVFMHPILPIANQLEPTGTGGRTPDKLTTLNMGIFTLSQYFQTKFGNRVILIHHDDLLANNFELKHELTFDHYHLNRDGYTLWANLLNRYL